MNEPELDGQSGADAGRIMGESQCELLGYTWAGVRAADLKSAAYFFSDTLGLSLLHEGNGMVQFEDADFPLAASPRLRYHSLHILKQL